MKKRIPLAILSLTASVIFSAGVLAQEQTEITIQVKKDGKVIQDTTYQFDDADEAKHAVMMMEVLSGHGEGMENVSYNYTTAHSGSGHSKAMVFISEDGEKTEIKEFHGDSLVWVSEEEGEGEHVIVMKSEDGNTFNILVDEDYDEGDIVMEKKIKVVVSGDENGTWNVVTSDDDDLHIDADHDQDSDQDVDVEVKVIKKKQKEEKK